jgi:hypothetical protein
LRTPEEKKAADRARVKRYRDANREKYLAAQRTRLLNNPDQRATARQAKQAWFLANTAKALAASRAWKRENPEAHSAIQAHRRAAKLQRTPAWADLTAIKALYLSCPTDHHVDHIVPLQGETVCGLHVHYNLQHLPAVENLRKGNRL